MFWITMLLTLFVLHFLCDYPLQGDFLAKAKNPNTPIPYVPWWQALSAHAAIHAGAVLLATGSVILFVIEFVAHFVIDWLKCMGRISFNRDQALHLALKVAYVAFLFLWMAVFEVGMP